MTGVPRLFSAKGMGSASPLSRAWSVRELEQAFVVSDANGQALAYVYFRKDENEARQARVLTHDEARRIVANIAKLPKLFGRRRAEQMQ